jgi:hypothetical protein
MTFHHGEAGRELPHLALQPVDGRSEGVDGGGRYHGSSLGGGIRRR